MTAVFDTEYEAHYWLISVHEADLHHWMSGCRGLGCRWRETAYGPEAARDAGLQHCREKHVRPSG